MFKTVTIFGSVSNIYSWHLIHYFFLERHWYPIPESDRCIPNCVYYYCYKCTFQQENGAWYPPEFDTKWSGISDIGSLLRVSNEYFQSRHMAFFFDNPSLVKAKIAAVKAKDCSHGRRQIPEYLRTTRMTFEWTVLV